MLGRHVAGNRDLSGGGAMSVTWGTIKFSADAEKCYREIESLGDCKPEEIVEFAEDEETELHKCFEWDDTKAAQRWRVQQARIVCNSLTVIVEEDVDEPISYRLIEHDSEELVYRPITVIARNEDQYNRLLYRARQEMAQFKKRYASLKELASVIDAIDRELGI